MSRRRRAGRVAVRRGGWSPPRLRRPRRAVWIVPVLLVLGALLWIPLRHRAARHAVPAGGPSGSGPLAGMSAEQALRTGLELNEAGRDAESLPYFRHALRGDAVADGQAHYNFATALYNATLRIEPRNGVPTYAVRSSWERIALVREAVQQLALAEGLARTPRERATVRAAYAQMVWLWGMPWDTFVAYRQAYAVDPANHALAVRGDGLMDQMRAPTTGGATAAR